MPIKLPNNATEIEQRQKTDVQRKLPTSNPFLPNSWLGALITGTSNRFFDFYIQLKNLLRESFWDTSTGDFLKRQASWFGFTGNAASKSLGNIVATGTLYADILTSDSFKTSNGVEYEVLTAVQIDDVSIDILSIERSGNTAIVTTDGAHGMASNVTPTISGANQSEYNQSDIEIKVTDVDKFTYEVSGSPTTPATGTISLSAQFAIVPVKSIEFQASDLEVNLETDTQLTPLSPITGVDGTAQVDAEGVTGGSSAESDDEFRSRFLEGVQNPTTLFNVQAIKDKAKEITGVTRVFVKEVTPDIGQVTVYFVRDNDDDIIPTSTQVTNVKNKILEIKPAQTSDDDVIVEAPSENSIDFEFSALTPDTVSMRNAIAANLDQFFKESTDVGVGIDEDAYRAAIFSTVDTETGQPMQTFALNFPSGDISNAVNELPTLGDIGYDII